MFWMGLTKNDRKLQKMPWAYFYADNALFKDESEYVGMIKTNTKIHNFSMNFIKNALDLPLSQWAYCFDALMKNSPRVILTGGGGFSNPHPKHEGVRQVWIATKYDEHVEFVSALFERSAFGEMFDDFNPWNPQEHADLLPDVPVYPGQPRTSASLNDVRRFYNQDCLPLLAHIKAKTASDD
jgi:hypothetical protein